MQIDDSLSSCLVMKWKLGDYILDLKTSEEINRLKNVYISIPLEDFRILKNWKLTNTSDIKIEIKWNIEFFTNLIDLH